MCHLLLTSRTNNCNSSSISKLSQFFKGLLYPKSINRIAFSLNSNQISFLLVNLKKKKQLLD